MDLKDRTANVNWIMSGQKGELILELEKYPDKTVRNFLCKTKKSSEL